MIVFTGTHNFQRAVSQEWVGGPMEDKACVEKK